MAKTFTGKVSVSISGTLTTDADIGTNKYSFGKTYSHDFTNGTGANQCNMGWTDTRTTSGNDDLDMAGVLTDAVGAAITFTSIKTIAIKAADANVGNLIVGAEGTNEFASMFGDVSDTLIIPPGGILVLTAPGATGYAVTASTGDKLRIAPSSGSVTYDIFLLGEI